jgi:hypothetical protein
MYIDFYDTGVLEISVIKDEYVEGISKDLNVNHKMAIQYLKHKTEIEQELNEVLYWNNINDIKKYVPVISDDGDVVHYADFNIYSKNIYEAIRALDEIYYDEYIYLEDVDDDI